MVTLNVGSAGTRFSDVNVDIRRAAFDHKRNTAYVIADASCLPFQAGTFSYIYASNVMEHLSVHPYDALNEFAFVCKLRGIIHVLSPTGNLKIILNELTCIPFIIARDIKRKRFKPAWQTLGHLLRLYSRLHGQKDTAFGGHKWFLPWGWKLYYRSWFPWKLRGWNGLLVMYEAIYYKYSESPDGEEYRLKLLKENEISPPSSKHVDYAWY